MQCQYAGTTSISTLEKVITLSEKIKIDRQDVDSKMQEAKKCYEDVKYEQQLLSTRLEIVERLKDILEQQIGAGNVQNMMEHYAGTSQRTLNVSLHDTNFFFYFYYYFLKFIISYLNCKKIIFLIEFILFDGFR